MTRRRGSVPSTARARCPGPLSCLASTRRSCSVPCLAERRRHELEQQEGVRGGATENKKCFVAAS